MTKYSFYAGNVTFSVAQNVFNLFDRCKESLDTNGNSWSDPITDFSQFKIDIQALKIPQPSDDEVVKTCANLAMNQNDDDNEEDMLVPLPKIETSQDENLSTIWLPLKRKHIFNINSKTSAFILFRYYVMVTQCFRYQGINQSIFNRKLKVWISENVIPYLDDDELYPAFGAVLRIMETIRDQHEEVYQGTKEKSRKSHRVDVLGMINSDIDEKFGNFSFSIQNRDVYWWCCAVSLAAGITFIIIILIYLLCRYCCKRKKDKNGDVKKSPSLTEKISNILKRNTHTPEHDEFYEYTKVPSKESQRRPKVLKFENEKSKRFGLLKKLRSKRSIEKFALPNLNGSDSEEIVLHEIKSKVSPSISSSSMVSSRAHKKNSEETDEIASLAARNLSMQPKFLERIRSKSPTRNKNQRNDS